MTFNKHVVLWLFACPFAGLAMEDQAIVRDIGVGTLASIAEVAVDQPFVTGKNMKQQGMPISLNPKKLWSGGPANALGLIPVTAIQVVGTNQLSQLHPFGEDAQDANRLVAATLAGGTSGFVAGPSEMVMLKQQNSGSNILVAAKKVGRYCGTGLLATICRDAGFTAGYLGLRPIFKKNIEDTISNSFMLNVASGVAAGVPAALATHPFDTAKTMMQANPELKLSMLQILRTTKPRILYNGGWFRTARVGAAVTIMGYITEKLSSASQDKE